MTAHGDTLDVFTPVLARLAADAASYFNVPAVRLSPAGSQERPFSHLLRLRVCDGETERTLSHLFVKVFKPKSTPGGGPKLRSRVANDFETTRRVHAAMAPYVDVGTVPPVACYPDLLAIITEQVDGPTLMEFLQKHAAWPRSGKSMGSLCETMERVGRWIRVLQATSPEGGRILLDSLCRYVDHRLKMLVQHGGGLSGNDRLAILNHIQALGSQIAPQDLKEVAIHSDLALGNILVSGGRIVVLDFAMSKHGTRLHDLTRLYVQLDLLAVKPRFSGRVVGRLQAALLGGFDPELREDRPLFRLLCLLHRTNHLTTLTVGRARPAAAVYNAFIRRRHRRWIRAELGRPMLEPA
jgi:tRNA A-37 threonylcarbamoyl transferase component Bud32